MDGRVDVARLYAALDAQRQAKGLSWRQLAHAAGVSPSLLSRMANGQRPDLDGFVALAQWLGAPVDSFTVEGRDADAEQSQPELEAELAPLLRARRDLTEADQQYLLEIVQATMRRVRANRDGG
jgi:transcriptional regulator with XRE-family HTH domain